GTGSAFLSKLCDHLPHGKTRLGINAGTGAGRPSVNLRPVNRLGMCTDFALREGGYVSVL
ncbi:MAG: hypothetical protein ABJP82_24380, partial [Hyphomicrobiales bacterium]